MSNLSDIGFPVKSEQDVNDVIMSVLPHLDQIPAPPRGFYYKFDDESGAQLYLQGNAAQDIIGFNPAFNGKSVRRVGLTTAIERDTSELDGAFKGWVNPTDEISPEDSGEYPLVFDMPDFRLQTDIEKQKTVDVQLTAFASSDFEIFGSEEEFLSSLQGDASIASQSFIPSGLFRISEEGMTETINPPQAHALITGEIKQFELRKNTLTGEEFYWFLAETFGGEIDVVADAKNVIAEPGIGGILKGSFWLSGKILS